MKIKVSKELTEEITAETLIVNTSSEGSNSTYLVLLLLLLPVLCFCAVVVLIFENKHQTKMKTEDQRKIHGTKELLKRSL